MISFTSSAINNGFNVNQLNRFVLFRSVVGKLNRGQLRFVGGAWVWGTLSLICANMCVIRFLRSHAAALQRSLINYRLKFLVLTEWLLVHRTFILFDVTCSFPVVWLIINTGWNGTVRNTMEQGGRNGKVGRTGDVRRSREVFPKKQFSVRKLKVIVWVKRWIFINTLKCNSAKKFVH